MNLMETIHLHKNDFSKTERKVYDYIVQNPTAIETATITMSGFNFWNFKILSSFRL